MRDLLSINIDPKCQLVLVLGLKSSKAEPKELRLRCPNNESYSSWLSCFVVFLPEPIKAGCVVPTVFARPIWELITYLARPEIAATEGIFRIPGEKAETDSLIGKILLRSSYISLSEVNRVLSKYQTTTLASVLKRLIDKMPHTLLSERMYYEFINLYKSEQNEKRLLQVRDLLRKLPQQSAMFLHHICLTLHRISQTIGNKMDAKSLSRLFGPMFVSRSKSAVEIFGDYEFLIQLFEDLIGNWDHIFPKTRPIFTKHVPRVEIALSIRDSPVMRTGSCILEQRKSIFLKPKMSQIRTRNIEFPPLQEFMLGMGRKPFYLPAVSEQNIRVMRRSSTPVQQPVVPWTLPSSPVSKKSRKQRCMTDIIGLRTSSYRRPRANTFSISKKNTFSTIREEEWSPKAPCISKSAWDQLRTPYLSSSTLLDKNESQFFEDSMLSLTSTKRSSVVSLSNESSASIKGLSMATDVACGNNDLHHAQSFSKGVERRNSLQDQRPLRR